MCRMLGNEIQRRRLVNLVWLTIGGSCVCIEEMTADLFYRRGEHNHNNGGVYELYELHYPARPPPHPPPLKDFWADLHFAIHRIMINITLFIYILYRNRNCSVFY